MFLAISSCLLPHACVRLLDRRCRLQRWISLHCSVTNYQGGYCSEALASCDSKLRESGTNVRVQSLQVTECKMLEKMKEGEGEKRKHYEALCWAERPLCDADKDLLDGIQELEVQQCTPVRVLHRRAPLVRTRVRPLHVRLCKNRHRSLQS